MWLSCHSRPVQKLKSKISMHKRAVWSCSMLSAVLSLVLSTKPQIEWYLTLSQMTVLESSRQKDRAILQIWPIVAPMTNISADSTVTVCLRQSNFHTYQMEWFKSKCISGLTEWCFQHSFSYITTTPYITHVLLGLTSTRLEFWSSLPTDTPRR